MIMTLTNSPSWRVTWLSNVNTWIISVAFIHNSFKTTQNANIKTKDKINQQNKTQTASRTQNWVKKQNKTQISTQRPKLINKTMQKSKQKAKLINKTTQTSKQKAKLINKIKIKWNKAEVSEHSHTHFCFW